MTSPSPNDNASAPTIRRVIADAIGWLAANAAAVDALNVYPVPDGDTGNNMLLTMRAGLVSLQAVQGDDPRELGKALAHGSLRGARGNSGVILSQICRGLAEGMDAGGGVLDATTLRNALRQAATRAYGAVGQPVEGTMLTVMRVAAEGGERADGSAASTREVLQAAVAAARIALAQTPEQLPVLKQAGVVDAGGQGLLLLLEGALASLCQTPLGPPGSLGEISSAWLTASTQAGGEHDGWGYCTQFLIEAPSASEVEVRSRMPADATSLLVVGDEQALHVHVHTMNPGLALSAAIALGTLHGIKVDNMSDQHAALAAGQLGRTAMATPEVATGRLPVVAVVPGEGLAKVFTSLGAGRIVAGGQSMNPSLQELADAVQALPGDVAILLPNNPNVQLVCQRVHGVVDKRVLVVATSTVVQGIAALLAGRFAQNAGDMAEAMTAGMAEVRSIEVTKATRTVTIDGVDVTEGQHVALLDRKIVACAPLALDVLHRALDAASAPSGSLVTLYYGVDVLSSAAEETASALRQRHDSPEVEVVDGGQPHYAYFASLEA
ncbi:MAG: DAK2 domain-containing protein [Dehalococcoidia bacterium]|nr:DAK2 domain-containing protein [Dehalococcoidia bacterium]